jgi:phosphate/phosphite/phosphonate ABC transporter binding protein
MQRESFSRMRFFPFLFAATFLASAILNGCSDSDRVQVDFRKRIDISHTEKQQPEATLKVAIASMISPNETIGHYQALLEYIATKIDRKFNLVQRKTYAEINGLLANGGIDLALICSGPYVADRERYHFEALAIPQIHQKSVYRAYFITGRTSPVSRLEDLRGKVFAFSDPDSNAGCIVPRFLLAEQGERPQSFFGKTIFTYSHDNSIMAVSRSLVDAAFVHEHIWEYYSKKNPAVTSRIRIVYESEPFGNPPLVASAFMPEGLRNRIRELLFSMHDDPEGAGILSELLIDRFIPPDEQLYDPIRRMLAKTRLLEEGHAPTSQP